MIEAEFFILFNLLKLCKHESICCSETFSTKNIPFSIYSQLSYWRDWALAFVSSHYEMTFVYQTLDLFAQLCRERRYPHLRLDGATTIGKRQKLVFNDHTKVLTLLFVKVCKLYQFYALRGDGAVISLITDLNHWNSTYCRMSLCFS